VRRRVRDGVEYLTSRALDAPGVVHAFLTRRGGVSGPPFDTLNLGPATGDARENLDENRAIVARTFGLGPGAPVTVRQVHGTEVHIAGDDGAEEAAGTEADAVITNRPGRAVGVLTADCLPVLLCDPVRGVVAAVHAGRRGTALGVVIKAVDAMRERWGTEARDLLVALGPHIRACCYEVGADVAAEFAAAPHCAAAVTTHNRTARLDMEAAITTQLVSAGLAREKIGMGAPCTSCAGDAFFSHRAQSGLTGRQMSLIMVCDRKETA